MIRRALMVRPSMDLPRLRTLEEVIRWAAAQAPPKQITDVVTQDEYTHDVVVAWDESVHLVFDTT
jgi:hypothetical protein